MHINTAVAIKPYFMSSLLYVLYFFIYVYSSITPEIQNFQSKDPKRFAFHIFFFNAVFITVYHVKAFQDDITANYFPSDCITLYNIQIEMMNR